MTQQTAAPYSTTDLTVPYGEKIAISTNGGGIVTIWYQTGPAVSPLGFYVHDRIVNEEVLLGTFAAEQVVRIETSGSPALYDIGASPSVGSGDADTLNGLPSDTTDTADTIAARDGSGDIQANAFESTVATGTAPLTVASQTQVSNLNASLLNGFTTNSVEGNSTIVLRDGNGNIALANGSKFRTKLQAGTVVDVLQITSGDVCYVGTSSAALVTVTSKPIGFDQGAPNAQTTDNTLTAENIAAGIITVNNGAAGTTTLTLPLATAMDSYYTGIFNSSAFDFYVINISTVAGEDATIATNTGWTLVGEMTIEANDSDRANTSAKFRARKTGAGAWTLYRLA